MSKDLLVRFQFFLAQKNEKKGTIFLHLRNIKAIFKKVKKFTKEEIDLFLASLKQEGKKNSYLNNFISTIRLWSQFQNLDKELQHYKFLPDEPTIKATMSDEEIEAFLNLPPPTTTHKAPNGNKIITRPINPKIYHRWTIFFSIMAYTGMRPGEVANLTINDIDWGRNVFVLRDTKTNEPRLVPIPPNIYTQLKDYLANLKTNHLFPSRRGVVNDVDWHYNFHSRIKRLGIKREGLSPYSLRHSFITRLLEEDVNLFKVQKIVGHRQIETTAHYTHLTTKDLQQTIQKHPLVRRSTSPQAILKALKELIQSFCLENDKRFSFVLVEKEKSLKLEVKIN